MERAASYMDSDEETVSSHLGVFSNDGLRTLLLAKKDLPKVRRRLSRDVEPKQTTSN